MKLIERNELTEIWETAKGDTIGICANNAYGERTLKRYYNIVVRKAGEKYGKTVKTRCTYEKAMQIVAEYE